METFQSPLELKVAPLVGFDSFNHHSDLLEFEPFNVQDVFFLLVHFLQPHVHKRSLQVKATG